MKTKTDYRAVKLQILEKILEKKSTSAISKKMGYSFNKVKRWREEKKNLHWNEFCDLCAILKIHLRPALASSIGFLLPSNKYAYSIVVYLKTFNHFSSTTEMAKALNVSSSTIRRYLTEELYPEIEFVLMLLDLQPKFLDEFLKTLLSSASKNKSLSIISIPWTSAVANAASLKRHSQLPVFSLEKIASFLGLKPNQVQSSIQLLFDIGLIEKKDEHYVPTLSRTIAVSQEQSPLDYSQFIKFWIRRCYQRLDTADGKPLNKINGPNKDGFRIFASSQNAANKITEILLKAEQEIHDVLQNDLDEKDDVRVFLFHHFSTQDHKS